MERFDTLKLKYQAVLNLLKQKGVVLEHLHVENDKLMVQGRAPSEAVKNEVWNQIKLADVNWSSDLVCDLSIDASLKPPAKTYTVVKGDSLWKIAQEHYGNGSQYPRIIAGNPERLKDEKSVIHPGDVLIIPD